MAGDLWATVGKERIFVSELASFSIGPDLVSVGIALGSNLGNRAAELDAGFAFLQALSAGDHLLRSSILETEPVDCPPGSDSFLNAVVEIQVDPQTLPPEQLLARLQQFEIARGRACDHGRNSPRPLDLDILYYGTQTFRSEKLVIPHPRIAVRRFVLQPLAEIRPGLVLPGQTLSARELLTIGA